NAQPFSLKIPQRHIDCRKRRHRNRTIPPARELIVSTVPVILRAGWIAPDEDVFQPAQPLLYHVSARFQSRFAQADQPRIRVDFKENEIPPAQCRLVNLEASDLCWGRLGSAEADQTRGTESSSAAPRSERTCRRVLPIEEVMLKKGSVLCM